MSFCTVSSCAKEWPGPGSFIIKLLSPMVSEDFMLQFFYLLYCFFFFKFSFFFLNEVQLIYNIVLVSGVQQGDSVIHLWILFHILFHYDLSLGFLGSAVLKNPPADAGDTKDVGVISGLGRSLGYEMATHSSVLSWRTSWTEEPGGLQSTGSPSQTGLNTHTHDSSQDTEYSSLYSTGRPHPSFMM